MSEAWLHLQSAIATGISNLDSSRCRNASLDKRNVGWTEVWGDDSSKNDASAWCHEDEVISRALSTLHPQHVTTLVQHRPAWFEQLILRFAGVPHIVVNSRYAATEATGPLPFLQVALTPCCLVGRHHPTACGANRNCILEYLQEQGQVSLDTELSPSQEALSHAFIAMVQSQLDPALLSLRFGNDNVWNQVYRQQYVEAGGRFQAWSIRQVAKKQLRTIWTVDEACAVARRAYQCLECQLDENQYLLGLDTPTTLDALVWAHLANALCDIHLVTILADYPRLVKYFQRVYDEYFRNNTDEEWKVWNQEQNLSSPFQKLPVEDTASDEPSTIHDALELMQSFSVHTRDLNEVLLVAKEKRLHDENQTPQRRRNTLYRWRMGDDIRRPQSECNNTEETTPQQEVMRKMHKRNDELWLSAVVAVTAIAVFFSGIRSER